MILSEAGKKIAALTKKIRVIQGGTSAGKTYSILSILILMALSSKKKKLVSIVSESLPHLKRGALRDFLKILEEEGLFVEEHFHKSNLIYQLRGFSFEFFSVDSPSKLRGARRDILFVNEANNINYESFRQLSIRTKELIYLDFNPVSEFWAHRELLKREDVDFLKLTYLDNKCMGKWLLPLTILKEIESNKHNENWWRVYGLGEIGIAQGVVFPHFYQVESLPIEAKLLGYGLDFGYRNDPSALVGLYLLNQEPIYHQVLYQKGLSNRELARLFKEKGVSSRELLVADSSEPKSIAELGSYGFAIVGAKKGADSLSFGLSLMSQSNFGVTSTSTELIRELRNYSWATNKEGKALNVPIDAFNHSIDAARYITTYKLGHKRKGNPLRIFNY